MLEVTGCTLLLAQETGAPRRPLTVHVSVHNQSNQFFTRCRLTVRLKTPRGFPSGELSLEGGVITPGEQVLSFQSSIPNHPLGEIDCELAYMLGRWVTTVRDIRLHEAAPPPEPPPGAAPEPEPEPLPPEDVARLSPVEGAEPWLGPDMDLDDEALEAALGPDMGLAGEDTGPDPDDPWSMLDADELEAAEALFREKPLDSDGRERIRSLLASPVPEQVALGIRISCWSRWSAPMMMMRLLDHPSAEVRLEAVTAIGLSAGPSLLNAVQPLLTDSDDDVQVAAALAVQRMRGLVPRR